jgi:adenosyl cobinamide kinase/adenosyl cobinamide phosphate guanylyltransferase
MPLILLVGGARSGKSRLAQLVALETGAPVTFIATGEARDAEMGERIDRHRHERPAGWRTIEEPLHLARALDSADPGDCVIVDCLTLWVSNLLERGTAADDLIATASSCAGAAAARTSPTIVVSNEVGLGIVPANELARAYRDVLGSVNAAFAAAAHRAALVVAGRAVELSPFASFLEGVTHG